MHSITHFLNMSHDYFRLQADVGVHCQRDLYPCILFPAFAFMMNFSETPMEASVGLYSKANMTMTNDLLILF